MDFWGGFFGGIFWDFLGGFIGGIFWEDFSGRNYLVAINKELMFFSRFRVNFVSMPGRKDKNLDL